MTELKTLKDIFETDEKDASGFITATILREEAVKWIKKISKDGFRKTPEITFDETGLEVEEVMMAMLTQETDIVVRWITHFFNITEEDLK